MRERLETMSDYPRLKNEKTEIQGQLRLLKKQLEEVQEEKQILQAGEAWLLFRNTSRESVQAALYCQVSHERIIKSGISILKYDVCY